VGLITARLGAGLALLALVLVSCGSTAQSPVVGNWTCRSPSNPTGDTVVVMADGTLTVTQPSGQSASGTWTVNGSTFTVHGLGPGGTEDFTVNASQMTGQGGQICAKTS
jgi:hypothetical protein